LRRHQRRGYFWPKWSEVEQDLEEEFPEGNVDHRRAWRKHFAEFMGVPPEKHWVFGGRRFRPWFSGKWGPPGLFNPFVAVMMSKGGGLLSLYVLHLLAEKPRYGNDIMHEIEDRTRGRWGSNPGAIYPLLTAMEERGFVESEWEDPDKRTKRTYRLTEMGRIELNHLKEVFRPKLEEAINVMRRVYEDLEVEQEGSIDE
jgi:PadR family transcriptional regulator PadR